MVISDSKIVLKNRHCENLINNVCSVLNLKNEDSIDPNIDLNQVFIHQQIFTVVTKDKTVHRLISPINLHLNESGLIGATFLANEKSLKLVSLGFNFFMFPICALLPHAPHFHLLSLSFLGLAS